jgi:hypothetical protein
MDSVHHVRTIALVAEMLCEDEEWLWDVANEMDQEDGLIWVYGPGDDGVMAFNRLWHRNPHRSYRDLQGRSRSA